MNDERKYLAVSIKHSFIDQKTRKDVLVFWGYKRTKDDESRCFSCYTTDPEQAELYSLEDWSEYINCPWMKINEPVQLIANCKKTYSKYDTILIEIEEIKKNDRKRK